MLTVIKPFSHEFKRESRMDQVLSNVLKNRDVEYILTAEEMEKRDLRGKKLLFAVCLSEAGVNLEYYRMLEYFRRAPDCLAGAVGAVIVDGSGELYTKALARRLVFSANRAGCAFPGKPLVEATGSLRNFDVMSKLLGTDVLGAYEKQVENLVNKLSAFAGTEKKERKKILVIHASSRKTSNSLLLWEKVKAGFTREHDIEEISLRDGSVQDCRGCKYETCLHFGELGRCFYGGVMTEKVYPAIIDCDALVMICPNYNDAVSANITAFINRLTSVFRVHDFSKKEVYALVVSGYSGGDIVAEQVIGAMNFNKNFVLPGNFAIVETANDPKSILTVDDLDEKTRLLAHRIEG